MISEILVAAIVVMLASLSGILFIQKTAQSFLETKLSYLISFSAGVFLITAGGLALEVFELAPSIAMGALLIGAGYVLASMIHALLPETHHHHDPLCEHKHGVAAKKLIIGDGIHNIADGIILVVAFTASPFLGIAATVSIFIHEALQEISEFFVLRQAGYSVKKALAVNLTVSSTILVGVFLGYFALATNELVVALLAVSAGFFLHVVMHDLLPRRSHHEDLMTFLKHVLIVIVGAILMGTIANYLTDSHAYGEGEHNEVHEAGEHEDEHGA